MRLNIRKKHSINFLFCGDDYIQQHIFFDFIFGFPRCLFKDATKGFVFASVIRYSRLRIRVGYLIYFKFAHVSSIVNQSLHF